jgi:hypothetical protein
MYRPTGGRDGDCSPRYHERNHNHMVTISSDAINPKSGAYKNDNARLFVFPVLLSVGEA